MAEEGARRRASGDTLAVAWVRFVWTVTRLVLWVAFLPVRLVIRARRRRRRSAELRRYIRGDDA